MVHQVAVIGEGVIDRFLEPAGPRDVIGGSPLNTAVALQRAGVNCDWWGRMSTSVEGDALVDYASRNGVAGSTIVRDDSPATLVTIELNADGVPSYGFHLDGASDWGWTESELDELGRYSVIQIGSLTSVIEPGSTALLHRLKKLRSSSTPPIITFDPNARPKAAKSSEDADRIRARVLELLAIADFVKVSDEDLEWLVPSLDPEASAAHWSTLGPRLVVMTCGAQGSLAFRNGQQLTRVASTNVDVVDTVGAGDTFMAWLLRSIVEDHAGTIPEDVNQVAAMLSSAAKAAAITCSRKGCNPPQRAEVL